MEEVILVDEEGREIGSAEKLEAHRNGGRRHLAFSIVLFNRNVETLLQSGMINNLNRPVKLLGEGELNKALKITVHACSAKAREIVEKAGGEVSIIS